MPLARRSSHSSKHTTKSSAKRDGWSASDYPYETDYNDHFETPPQAYADVQPLIDWLVNETAAAGTDVPQSKGTTSKDVVLYDPFYCNGRTKVLLHELGYNNVTHDKRDFYADMAQQTIPSHDILITNPPYSDTHKKRCLDFSLDQLRNDGNRPNARRPFLLLMPAYTAAKQYYRTALLPTNKASSTTAIAPSDIYEDVVYLVPSSSYHYDHPDETGKDQSPFDSLWFCGIGSDRVPALQQYWESLPSTATPRPTLVTSLADLAARHVITLVNRPNPRQRDKKRKQLHPAVSNETPPDQHKRTNTASIPKPEPKLPGTDKKSKYRDPSSGKRTKKRF